MILTEKHIITKNHPFFNECDSLCFKSKDLYNTGLYTVRQFYFDNKKYLNYNENYNKCKSSDAYKELPAKVAQQTLKMVEQNFKSFFKHIKSKNKLKKVKLPKYLDKNGRYVTTYTNQALSLKEFKISGKIKLSKTNILIKTRINNWGDIKQVRIIPKGSFYVIEILYNKIEKKIKGDNKRYCSIDLGLNNLATVGSNVIRPFIINGKPLKSINQYYNKEISKYKSELSKYGKKSSKRIRRLGLKRSNKINDYLHKQSRILVNHLVSNNINTLVIGKNNWWKQDINIGKKNNQNFVQIPFNTFVEMISYKCKLEGIKVIYQEESYTSKCSFLDNEAICKHEVYKGKRIKRGLFKSSDGILINADLNGALNIMRKAIPNAFADGIEVCSEPFRIKS